jgi:hypothetical protein
MAEQRSTELTASNSAFSVTLTSTFTHEIVFMPECKRLQESNKGPLTAQVKRVML